eukprot:3434880-Prymnesium_polylepis.1
MARVRDARTTRAGSHAECVVVVPHPVTRPPRTPPTPGQRLGGMPLDSLVSANGRSGRHPCLTSGRGREEINPASGSGPRIS